MPSRSRPGSRSGAALSMDRREYVAKAREVALHQAAPHRGNSERIVILSDDRDMGGDSIVIAEPTLMRYELRTLRTLAVTAALAEFELTQEEAVAIVNDLCGLV